MMNRKAFEQVFPFANHEWDETFDGTNKYVYNVTRQLFNGWNAGIAHVKSQYTLCEKEPDSHKDVHINGKWKTVPLYRESQS